MKPCLVCGKPVNERTDRNVKFCSIACFNTYQTRRKERPCAHCDIPFLAPRNHAKQKFCSTVCRDAARTSRINHICAMCGKPTTRKKARNERLTLAFCSKVCTQNYRKAYPISGEDHVQYLERTRYTCSYCGRDVYRLPSCVRQYVFCNVQCRLQWQRESGYMYGPNSPTWLGGYVDERGPNWTRQTLASRKRDHFTCQRCGATEADIGKALDVHHIKPWRSFADDWQSANHLDNLISLCNRCHQIVEWETGSKSTLSVSTTSQFVPAVQASDLT